MVALIKEHTDDPENPSVRPVGMGEIVRRMITSAITTPIRVLLQREIGAQATQRLAFRIQPVRQEL